MHRNPAISPLPCSESYSIGGYEVYRKYIGNSLDKERETVHIMDDRDRFAMIDTLTVENGTSLTTPVETLRYQYSNHLGSACLELDASANIISYEEYHPFGTTSYRAGSSEAEVSLKRYKYVGKERDEETGLYYYGARYYAAWLCRFISVDPLNEKYPELSAYQYASNRSISGIDLDGLEYLDVTNPNIETVQCDESGKESITFNDGSTASSSGVVDYNGKSFFNIGQHLYTSSNGITTIGNWDDVITEWVYNSVEKIISDKDIIEWKSDRVKGTYWNSSTNKYEPRNQNCCDLAKTQGELGGGVWNGQTIQIYSHDKEGNEKIFYGNYHEAIDYIHKQLELGKAVVVGVDISKELDYNGDGTDHFITIVNRGSEYGNEFFYFYENAVMGKDWVTSPENKIQVGSEKMRGMSPYFRNFKTNTVTKILKNY